MTTPKGVAPPRDNGRPRPHALRPRPRRPALDQLLTDARRRRFDVVAVVKLDRVARPVRGAEHFRRMRWRFARRAPVASCTAFDIHCRVRRRPIRRTGASSAPPIAVAPCDPTTATVVLLLPLTSATKETRHPRARTGSRRPTVAGSSHSETRATPHRPERRGWLCRRRIISTPAAASSKVIRALPHSGVDGTPGAPHTSPQRLAAASAHWESQLVSQQNGSSAQTAPQHDSDSQDGEPLDSQHPPVPAQVAPLQEEAPQTATAASAHSWSQALLQQEPSVLHTSSQQLVASQPGLPLAAQQSPGPGQDEALQAAQSVSALSAQNESQELRQQKGSRSQTCWQQPASSQPGVPFPSQHPPLPGQL